MKKYRSRAHGRQPLTHCGRLLVRHFRMDRIRAPNYVGGHHFAGASCPLMMVFVPFASFRISRQHGAGPGRDRIVQAKQHQACCKGDPSRQTRKIGSRKGSPKGPSCIGNVVRRAPYALKTCTNLNPRQTKYLSTFARRRPQNQAIGANVTKFTVGDEIFETSIWCIWCVSLSSGSGHDCAQALRVVESEPRLGAIAQRSVR